MLAGAAPSAIALAAPSTSTTTATTQPSATPAANDAGDPTLWTILPILITLFAAGAAAWSAWSAHRSSQSASQSATLNEQRRREDQAPQLEFVAASEAPSEGVRIVNLATVAYTSVRFTIVPHQDEPEPVEALLAGYHEPELGFQQQWIKAGEAWDLGPLGAGEAQVLDLRRPRLNEPGGPYWPTTGGTLRMLIECKTSTYTVLVIRTCDIPPTPQTPFALYG